MSGTVLNNIPVYIEQRRKELPQEIEYLRRKLETIINRKGTRNDPEVLAVSRELDEAVNEYYRLFR